MKKGFLYALAFLALLMCMSMFGCDGGSNDRCTICGKEATHQFQGSGYCTKHYNDAVSWAIDNVSDN
ncbi:MAG: hypothetical protein E7559_08830 [Ruminococcaceae bacterium]|nr:hypothetical protein [Oscillospiraceae bacterium]